MKLKPLFETNRKGIGIHPDGAINGNWWIDNGTLGCIGLLGCKSDLERFYNLVSTYLYHFGFITVISN
jgi:hypothetical protein